MVDPITISADDLLGSISGADAAALNAGALSGDEVWYQYWTQEDDKVRPSHAALNGSVWRVGDANAPVPPTTYGCRCYISYIAPPDSPLSDTLPPAPSDVDPVPVADLYADALDSSVPDWRKLWRDKWAKLKPAERLNAIYAELRKRGVDDARDVAVMIDTAASRG